MRNIKKIIKIGVMIVSVYAIFILGRGLYWYYDMDRMNVPITISTQYSEDPTDIEVSIDGKIVFKDSALQTLYASTQIHLPLGFHKLRVIVDGEEFVEHFFVFPVKWIYMEVQKYGPNYKDDENWFFINCSSQPIGLM